MNRLVLGRAGKGWALSGPEESLLVLGPPRSGKTSAIVIPNVLAATGAVVATSTKTDVAGVTASRRIRMGKVWHWDPSAVTPPPIGTLALSWSPVRGCDAWDTAFVRAHLLASASRPGVGVENATHWVNRAEALLAPLLHAAALADLSMRWVMRWVLSAEVSEARAIIASRGSELAGDSLDGILGCEDRERSGIFSTAGAVLSAYRSEAALGAASADTFDPAEFVAGADTLYICAPARTQDQLAPIVVALLDEIRSAAYANTDRAPMVWALDEVAHIAPIPFLPAVAAEGGGQGLLTIACLQDLSQARARWGAAAEGFVSLFGTKLVFPGIGDQRTLELISSLAGEQRVLVKSRSSSRPPWAGHSSVTTSTVWRRRLPVDAVASGHPGFALVFGPHQPVAFLELAPWYAIPGLSSLPGSQPASPRVTDYFRRRRSVLWTPKRLALAAALIGALFLPLELLAVVLVAVVVFVVARRLAEVRS